MQVDRSQRSVFVGNISYEVPEETIRQIFSKVCFLVVFTHFYLIICFVFNTLNCASKVGHVVHIKMVHDRETGKPKGYGFIEYEVNGRQLRVDSAAGGDRSADEIQQLQAALSAAQVEESPYGPEPEEGRAPEVAAWNFNLHSYLEWIQAISRTVASLPPEKMFELMKQMKDVVRSNPSEAKQMLVQNPQLAYALLQAQVVMRIVDPQVAIAMLHREPAASTVPFHQMPFAGTAGPVAAPVSQGGFVAPPQQVYGRNPAAPAQVCLYGNAEPPQQPEITPDEQHNAELLVQVMRLTEAEIAMLPPGDREKVIELRNQLRQSV
ncbi:unnamed protein product [Strongylus vulgaris]|uniref:RRM domain-containing protein n=1 Tax=Strongylus vulgaris TaxID=40348 RepID=A0A3P7J5M7_STRVU|nr:unnamed protein product [Strongylus vulgaris]